MRTTAAICLFALACAGARALPAGLDNAVQASRDGNWSEALPLWEAASDRYPNDPDVTAETGFAEFNSGRVQDAKRSFNRAVRLSPSNVKGQIGLAQIAVAENHVDEAVAIATRAATVHPDSADAYRCLGDAQKAASRRAEAEDAYRRAVALGPGDWRNHSSLASAALIRGKAELAVKEYREASRLNPGDGTLREALGRAAMSGRHFGVAAQSFVDAMDIERASAPDWGRMDTLSLAAIHALSRAAVALRDGEETREDVFTANTRALAVTDALLEIPSVASAEPHADPAMAQRALAYSLMGQAAASDLAAMRKTTGSEAADAAVFREQARRAVVAARAASLKPAAT